MQQVPFWITLVLLISVASHAKPASPSPVKRKMADGTIVTVIIKGDEKSHALFSTDGYLLLSDDKNSLFYADSNAQISNYPAHDIEQRADEEKAFLHLLDQEKIKDLYFQ